MKFISLMLMSLLLFGCASAPKTPVPLASEPASTGIQSYAIGTLAPLGSFEWYAAPSYTRNAVLRHNAAVQLRKGAITVEQAVDIQARADHIRQLLDAAVAADAKKKPTEAQLLLKAAGDRLEQAYAELEGK